MAENSRSTGGSSEPKPPARKPDLASIGGLALGLFGILGGLIMEGGKLKDVAQITAAVIVLGGTAGAVLVSRSPRQAASSIMHLTTCSRQWTASVTKLERSPRDLNA